MKTYTWGTIILVLTIPVSYLLAEIGVPFNLIKITASAQVILGGFVQARAFILLRREREKIEQNIRNERDKIEMVLRQIQMMTNSRRNRPLNFPREVGRIKRLEEN